MSSIHHYRYATSNWNVRILVGALLLLTPSSLSLCQPAVLVSNVPIVKIPLRRNDDASPYCFAVSSISNLQSHNNFLATQVWPAARVAAAFLETQVLSDKVICELGCGPGLPSLTAAAMGAKRVVATDLDSLAMELVTAAARDQQLLVETKLVDLCATVKLPSADLYILSDVFESDEVAKGAARLLRDEQKSTIWVFCQSDRAQRQAFLDEMRMVLPEENLKGWIALEEYDSSHRISMFNVEECDVCYG